jgi:cytidylate kinase
MIITISGNLSSGKSTVAEWLAKELGYKYYYAGSIQRELAKKHGMSINKFQELEAKDPKWDREVDDYFVKLGKKYNLIADSHLAFHFIPNSLKIFLDVKFDVAVERRWKQLPHTAHRNEGEFKTKKALAKALKERLEMNRERWKRYYGVDAYDKSNYDIVIDTTKLTIPQVEKKVLEEVKKHF